MNRANAADTVPGTANPFNAEPLPALHCGRAGFAECDLTY